MMNVRFRCESCGNKTRFDVYVRRYSREFWHASLGGDVGIDEQDTLEEEIERVVCRWCGSTDVVKTPGSDAGKGAGRALAT
jgi:RNase P subunit RPR2